MTRYKCGDVVLVEVVFSDGTSVKKRPALVLSSDDYHNGRQEVIIAAITSNVDRILAGDSKVDKWKEAGLLLPSVVTGIVQTVKSKMIERRLGVLEKVDLVRVQKSLKRVLGILC